MTGEHQERNQVGIGLGRRTVLKGVAAAGLGSLSARGLYGILEDVVRPEPASAAAPTVVRRLQEQYLVERIEVVVDNGVTVGIPPVYIGDLFDLTSKRIGFLGRGFNQPSASKKLALAANIPAADKIPDRSQLMMGFTSTQTNALAPDNLPSFETLRGVTNQWPGGYFAAGCAMHLSHLYLDLAKWYGQSYSSRVGQMFSPHTAVPASSSTVTISNGPADVATMAQVTSEAASRRAGHNSLLQQATRLGADVLDNYGRLRKKGTAVPLREDFNTIDDPFAWTPTNGTTTTYAAGMHFVAFVPGHHLFHRARMAMDGHMPNGSNLGLTPDETGINGLMKASHRQNYVIPPRKNRSFPLVELLK